MATVTSEISRAALRSLRRTEFVVTSTRTQKERVSAALGELFHSTLPPAADGSSPVQPDWNQIQESNAALLEQSAEEVRRDDKAHRLNVVRLAELRRERRRKTAGFKLRYRNEKQSFTGTYHKDALALAGLDGLPAASYLGVREQLVEFVERLRNPELAARLPEPQPGRRHIELSELADAVEGQIQGFNSLMDEIQEQRKVTEESMLVRRATLKRNRRLYINIAHVQEGYYRLVGLDDLADRIRTADPPRRKKEAQATADSDPTAETAEPQEAEPGETEPQETAAPTAPPATP